jgi:hypothetical protein
MNLVQQKKADSSQSLAKTFLRLIMTAIFMTPLIIATAYGLALALDKVQVPTGLEYFILSICVFFFVLCIHWVYNNVTIRIIK